MTAANHGEASGPESFPPWALQPEGDGVHGDPGGASGRCEDFVIYTGFNMGGCLCQAVTPLTLEFVLVPWEFFGDNTL